MAHGLTRSGGGGGLDLEEPTFLGRSARAVQTRLVNYKRHIGSLDGLRGVAICLVFLHHYYPRPPVNGISVAASLGWVGVDVFFVLSGFLITGILFDTLHTPRTLRNFFARRALRLFPVYTVLVVLVVLLARPLHVPLDWRDIPFFAYAANWTDAFGITPPSFGPYLRFNHLWSLAVEEQFYLLWAPLVFLLKGRRRIMIGCAVGIVTAVTLRAVGIGHVRPNVLYENLFTHMDAILCGSMFALGIRGRRAEAWLSKPRLRWMIVGGLMLLGAGCVASHSLFDQRGPILLVGYIGNDLWCTGLLGLALLDGTVTNRVLNNRLLRVIGRYSYGLYLWHEVPAPAFESLMQRIQHSFGPLWLGNALGCGAVFAISMVVAMISFHLIELPFLHLKRYFSYDRRGAAGAEEESIDLKPAQPGLGETVADGLGSGTETRAAVAANEAP